MQPFGACTHTCIHTCIQTHIHVFTQRQNTYIHTYIHTYIQVVSVCKAVRAFVAEVKASLEFDPVKTTAMSVILQNLSSTIEPRTDPNNATAIQRDVFKRQTLMRELQLLDSLANLTNFRMWSTTLRNQSVRELRHSADCKHLRSLCEDAFHLLLLAIRGNHPNGVHMVNHLESLVFHLSEEKMVTTELPR
jgi:hypothetical protein